VVSPSSQYKTLLDLLNYSRAKPSALNFGHAGIGSGTHLSTEKLIAAAKVQVTQVPFKGTPEVVQAIFAGSVDCYWVPISAGMSHIRNGKLRALAVGSATRSPALPDVPTIDEAAGMRGAEAPLSGARRACRRRS
jgi:tripartite-type tricarboxylate transporter receptor subunit TctC